MVASQAALAVGVSHGKREGVASRVEVGGEAKVFVVLM